MNNIEIKGLTKKYSDFILENINLQIPKGSIVGLVGENGAGKTTLIKLIMNVIQCEEGTISIFGMDHQKESKKVKQDIGIVLEDCFFSEYLIPRDLGKILKHFYTNWDQKLYEEYLIRFKIPDKKRIKDFSKGMKMKLQIITALSHHPKLLILDEPTSGLDPVVRNEILDLFLEFIQDEEKSVLLSTHITSDLEHIADYITFLHEGHIVLSESREELLEEYGIIKCDEKQFTNLDPDDYICYQKTPYAYEVLIKDRHKSKYASYVIDKATIETIMLLMIKGERK